MTVCRMTQSKIKVAEVQKLLKWPISKSVSSASASMHVIKRLMANYDTPREHLNFNWTDHWYSSSFGIMSPSDLGVPSLANKFCLLRGVDQQSCMGLIFILVLAEMQ